MRSLRKSLALLLALAMVLSAFAVTTVSAKTFSDTSGHWAETWIEKWSDNGVINGYEDGTFRPDDFITRAELAKIISTAKSYTALADIAFADVAGDEWYAADLKKCVAQGVIGGYEDGTFRPDEYITREEASAMFVRAYNINAIGMLNFADNNDISEWSKTAVTALVGAGVINGYEDGTFLPKATITRAEVVKILDGVDSVVVSFPQATNSTGGTNTVTTIGNLGNSGGSSGGGGGSSQSTPSYKVTFNANGGSFSDGKATASITIGRNSVIGSKAPQPVRAGMSFEGWYTSADAANELISSKKWDVNAAVTRNLTLYAGWYIEGKVVVSFETNGGSPAVPSQTIDSGSFAEMPNVNLTRAHYTFDGWYTKNVGGTKVNFSSTPIRINTRFYAKWTVDSDYADKEITIPNVTTGSYQNGTVEAVPPSVLPGETVTISITPPSGFEVEGMRSITYTSTETGEQSAIAESAIKYNEETDEFSFVMPEDVQDGTLMINPHYVEAAPPTATPVPVPTVDPNVPTPEPVKEPTYIFTSEGFSDKSSFPANTEIDGMTVNKDSSIEGNSKTFTGSGYKYTKVCKIGTATLSFKVDGPCTIMIDAVSASSEDREYQVLAGSELIGSFKCLNGAANTATFYYTETSAQTISIKPTKGCNLYGIFVDYDSEILPATPAPTVNPNIKYDINIADSIKNGSIVVNNGSVSSDEIYHDTWVAADIVPDNAVGNKTPILAAGEEFYMNGVDGSGGSLTLYEEVHSYDETISYGDGIGTKVRVIRGETNPAITLPITDEVAPGGSVCRYVAGKDGYVTITMYLNITKLFNIYDNTAQAYIVNGYQPDAYPNPANVMSFTFAVEQGNDYYFWAAGSKAGVISITYSNDVMTAKAGDKITVMTKPESGYKAGTVFTDPETKVIAGSEANTYTFTMPASDVTVGATFIDSSLNEYTVTAEQPENGTVSLEKEVSIAASGETLIDTADSFLMADGDGGKWIVSSDGTLNTTAVSDSTNIGGNGSDKIKLTDKAVQYVLDEPITEGSFELSYDFYDDNTADAGRSFRTYFDNAAHQYDASTGQATEMGNTSAFFHMTDIGGKVYVTDKESDVGASTAVGTQIGDKALEANKWYRVVIKGDLDNNTLDVAYYLHGSDGQYSPDNISETPYISSSAAKFTDGRTAKLAQVKFMRTAAGNLYYDNIKLTAVGSGPKTLKAYNGETIYVVTEPDDGYELYQISAVDSAGNSVEVSNSRFVMPNSDVTVTVKFALIGTVPTPEPTLDPNAEYTATLEVIGGTGLLEEYTEPVVPQPGDLYYYYANNIYAASDLTNDTSKGTWAEFTDAYKTAYEAFGSPFGDVSEFAARYTAGTGSAITLNSFIVDEDGTYDINMMVRHYKSRGIRVVITKDGETTPTFAEDIMEADDNNNIPRIGNFAGNDATIIQGLVALTQGTYKVELVKPESGTRVSNLTAFSLVKQGATAAYPGKREDRPLSPGETEVPEYVASGEYKFKADTIVEFEGTPTNDGALPTIVVTSADGKNVTVDGMSFIMPPQGVTVNVTYAEGSVVSTPEPIATTNPNETPDADVTVIKAADFTYNRTGSRDDRPGPNDAFSFGTATDAYAEFVGIFGENAVDAGDKAVTYNGKGNGNFSFKFTPEQNGSYTLYLLAASSSSAENTRVIVSSDTAAKIDFTASGALNDSGAVALTANSKFELTADTEYTFTVLAEDETSQYTANIVAAALAI